MKARDTKFTESQKSNDRPGSPEMDHPNQNSFNLLKRFAEGENLVLDGGLATRLEEQGHALDSRLWSAQLILSDPEEIIRAHLAYLEAGADIITTASYQATLEGFMELGLTLERAREALLQSVQLAVTARERFLADHPDKEIFIAASVGPYGAYLADGSEYRGNYGLSITELTEFHRERMELLCDSTADLIACETIPDFTEAKVLGDLLRNCGKPAWICFSCRDGKSIHDGTLLANAATLFNSIPNVIGVGINCTPPQYTSALIEVLKAACPGKSIVVYPNSGEHYCGESRSWEAGTAMGNFPEQAQEWQRQGADIIGGCCRVGPGDIAEIARGLVKPF